MRKLGTKFNSEYQGRLNKCVQKLINGDTGHLPKGAVTIRRSRGFYCMESHFGKHVISDYIHDLLRTRKVINILEIGFGEGRCLLEIGRMFSNDKQMNLYGLNLRKEGGVYRREDLLKNAQKIWPQDIKRRIATCLFL